MFAEVILLLIATTIKSVVSNEPFYWRIYNGSMPNDAFPTGTRNMFVGRVGICLEMAVDTSSSSPSSKRRRDSTPPPLPATKNRGRACEVCGEFLPTLMSLETHLRTEHAELIDKNVAKIKSCYKNRVVCYKISEAQSEDDIPSYLLKCCETVNRLIEQHLNENGSIKAQIEILANFIKSGYDDDGNEEVITSEKNFNTKFKIITATTVLNEV
nr:uncharacterized protein LOC111419603 [Onthophagus taurus]